MESMSPSLSPDKSDVRPSFRKPLNDAACRKYRRHSPVSVPDSSSSDGSHKYEQDLSPNFQKDDHKKVDNRRRDDGREVDREISRNRNGRVSDSPRHSDRNSYANSDDHRRTEDYNRHYRSTDDEDRTYHRYSRSGQESKGGRRPEHTREESYSERYREHRRSADRYSRDKYESGGQRNKDKKRDVTDVEHRKLSAKDSTSDRPALGSRYAKSYKEDTKTGERYRHGDRGGWEDKRDRHRSPIDYKNDSVSLEGRKDILHKRKHDNRDIKPDNREYDRCKDKYSLESMEDMQNENKSLSSSRERDVSESQKSSMKKLKSNYSEKATGPAAADEKPPSSLRQIKDTAVSATTEPTGSASQTETAHDLNAAKVAAMKAAELVNRNLVGGACLSTDQKKKLLWGNKKTAAAEESGNNRWDLTLFPDRERQEKFNKLMGVKGDIKPEHKLEDMDGTLQAEKQKELQLDLEKQYTAGLRRRDGRTVGLGL